MLHTPQAPALTCEGSKRLVFCAGTEAPCSAAEAFGHGFMSMADFMKAPKDNANALMVYLSVEHPLEVDRDPAGIDESSIEQMRASLEAEGYDGLKIKDGAGRSCIYPLAPSQITFIMNKEAGLIRSFLEMDIDAFIGPSLIGDYFDIDGDDEDNYGHLWESLVDGDGLTVLQAKDGWTVRWLDGWEPHPTLGLISPEGKPEGFYMGGQLWINEDARGRGLSALMIEAAADMMGGYPIADHSGMGFSEAGYAAHLSALGALQKAEALRIRPGDNAESSPAP